MSSFNSKGKSSGLRMLWIPGRKGHGKGRILPTYRHVAYSAKPKKSEVWSLGGSQTQRNMLIAAPDTELLDGPASSSVSAACSLAAVAAATGGGGGGGVGTSSGRSKENEFAEAVNTSESPDSTTSMISLTSSTATGSLESTMPVKAATVMAGSATTAPVAAAGTTTTVEIIDDGDHYSPTLNKTTMFNYEASNKAVRRRRQQQQQQQQQQQHLQPTIDMETATSTAVAAASPSKSMEMTNNGDITTNKLPIPQNHNNNHHHHHHYQDDLDSIEPVPSEHNLNVLRDLDWVDELYSLQKTTNATTNGGGGGGGGDGCCDDDVMPKEAEIRRKRNKFAAVKERDQLDGLSAKDDYNDESNDEDDKVVKCLYYTLMCCDCSIS